MAGGWFFMQSGYNFELSKIKMLASALYAIAASLSKIKGGVMSQVQGILQSAQQRSLENGFPYLGALTPSEAYAILQADPKALLVDVRTKAELELVGRVPNALNLEWAFYPGMVKNEQFAEQLVANVDKDLTVLFLCRTGGRSHNAAVLAEQLGYAQAYNILEGFEGEANALKQRTTVNGWKHANLPWTN
jgi:rhodanese-related sulfurtransferase